VARRRKASDTAIGALVALTLIVVAFQKLPTASIAITMTIIAAALVGSRPGRCEVRSAIRKRSRYTWTIDGKRTNVCPNCNRGLERRQSSAALGRTVA